MSDQRALNRQNASAMKELAAARIAGEHRVANGTPRYEGDAGRLGVDLACRPADERPDRTFPNARAYYSLRSERLRLSANSRTPDRWSL